MKLSREALVLGAVIIGFTLVSLLAGRPPAPSDTPAASYSTYSSRPDGLKALYLFLRQEGFRAERWERPLRELPQGRDTLVLVWPEEPLDKEEAGALSSWVRSGGTVVLVPAGSRDLTPGTRNVGPEDSTLGPRQPLPVAAQVRRIHVPGRRRFSRDPEWGGIEIFGDAGGPVVIAKSLGPGRIFALSDPEILSNQGISREDNLTLALNLLTPPGAVSSGAVAPANGPMKGRIFFDEYHHGYQSSPGLWESLPPSVRGAALQLGLALAFYLYLRGRRFGRPVSLPLAPPRAGVEYVLAQANIYRQARAGGAALGYLYRGLLTDLASSLGVPPGTPHADLAFAAARRYGWDAGDLERLLNQCSEPRRTVSEAEILRLGQRIDHYRKGLRARASNHSSDG